MLVDIAVPRNVDPECDDLDDVRAYDVDSLKAVVERNTAKRRREIVEAEKLLEEEQASFRAWITALGDDRRLVHEVLEGRAREADRAGGDLAEVHFIGQGLVAAVDAEDGDAAVLVRQVDWHAAVEAAGAQERRVEDVASVGRREHDHTRVAREA